ncbi:futalosine hydrolase [Olivibacter sitiensis]|uniref:futalosine hydrolase n=1 Tax=Olivibacter sitiensis TaxID=376470 RepID=UPI0003FD7CCA|nr:futalosine hydrolase [Olivibacter sitiensis]
MNLLLVVATNEEAPSTPVPPEHAVGQHHISILVTGAGMVATAYALGRHLSQHQYDLVINLGIAGALCRSLSIGDIVYVNEDCFIELGAEDGDQFLSIDMLGFGQSRYKAIPNSTALQFIHELPEVSGITVNKVHGSEHSIALLRQRTDAKVESMEGAAFYYSCHQANQPCVQLRAISNYVERRNKAAWDIGKAIQSLHEFLHRRLAR